LRPEGRTHTIARRPDHAHLARADRLPIAEEDGEDVVGNLEHRAVRLVQSEEMKVAGVYAPLSGDRGVREGQRLRALR
jgi:hypothetical protein